MTSIKAGDRQGRPFHFQESLKKELSGALREVAKAIVLRNSRFAEEVLNHPDPAETAALPVWFHIRSAAELALRINEEPQLKAYEDLPKLAELTALLIESDERSDGKLKEAKELFERINKDVQVLMKKTPNNVNRGMNLILIVSHFVAVATIVSSS